MKMRQLVVFAVLAAAFPFFVPPSSAAEPYGSGTRQTTPEQDLGLAGWKSYVADGISAKDLWALGEDGVIHCKGESLGYLYTERDYGDFTLELDWRWPAQSKSGKGGVLIRMTGQHKIWPRSLEAQINAGGAGDFWGLDGYPLKGPADRWKTLDNPDFGKLTNLKRTEAAEKPAGQWNHYRITAVGDVVTLEINGRTVNRATGCDRIKGKIILTAEGTPIDLRNVLIKPAKSD